MISLLMEYTDIGTVTFLRVFDSVSARAAQLRTDGLQMNCGEGDPSHAYNINHPIETQLTSCDGIHWHQVQWHYYVYCFCECSSSTTGGTDGLNELVWGRASHDYIIKHPIETQLTPFYGIHWHQVQWHYYVYDSVLSARAAHWGRWFSNEFVWGRADSANNQAPQLKHIDSLMEYTDIRYSDFTTCIDSVSARAAQRGDGWSPMNVWGHPVSCYIISTQSQHNWLLVMEYTTSGYRHYYVYWFCECQSWGNRTDGLQINIVVRESSLMLT